VKVVLANGCWDPLHFGHLLHLMAAREMGDQLVVSITSDVSVRQEKGDGRPALSESRRKLFIDSLRFVGWTVVVHSAIHALDVVKPNVFVKGRDYIGKIGEDVRSYCDQRQIKIEYTNTPKWSATELLQNEFRRG